MVWHRRAAWPTLTGPVALIFSLIVAVSCVAPPQARKEHSTAKIVVRTVTAEEPEKPVKVKSSMSLRGKEPTPSPQSAVPSKIARRAINNDPAQLMGLEPAAINHLLGKPSLLRTEPPAQVWQYKIADCVLDIFLYTDETEPENVRVSYFEIRGGETALAGTRACFSAILESRMIPPGTTPKS
tara:strand:+ start:618 stop:1166 length:549 start_codon:yes stop_codon:yes gene_type:complete